MASNQLLVYFKVGCFYYIFYKTTPFYVLFWPIILCLPSSSIVSKGDQKYRGSRCHPDRLCSPSLAYPCCLRGRGYNPRATGPRSSRRS